MTGVVKDLISWYVPNVLNWSDRFVNTTNPQNDKARGIISITGSFLGVKISSITHIWRPIEVITKWTKVRDMLGYAYWTYMCLLIKTIPMAEARLRPSPVVTATFDDRDIILANFEILLSCTCLEFEEEVAATQSDTIAAIV